MLVRNSLGAKGHMGKNLLDDSWIGCVRELLTLLGKTSEVSSKNVLYSP